jgi:flagellar hook-basal body complex protein FliE
MLTLPISAVRPIAAPTAIQGAGATQGVSGGAGAAGGSKGNLFSDALQNVQSSLDNADTLAKQLASGQLTDVHVYTAAATKAELAVQLTVAVRDRLVEAYQEIMRMQI